jgi:hypothetical protein
MTLRHLSQFRYQVEDLNYTTCPQQKARSQYAGVHVCALDRLTRLVAHLALRVCVFVGMCVLLWVCAALMQQQASRAKARGRLGAAVEERMSARHSQETKPQCGSLPFPSLRAPASCALVCCALLCCVVLCCALLCSALCPLLSAFCSLRSALCSVLCALCCAVHHTHLLLPPLLAHRALCVTISRAHRKGTADTGRLHARG